MSKVPVKKTPGIKDEKVTMNYMWAVVVVDLNEMCPVELFKKLKDVSDKNRAHYIPAPLVREVIRCRGGIQIIREDVKQPMVGANYAVIVAEVTVSIDGEIFCGSGMDCISNKKLAAAAMGQGGHVAALALKSALKKRFKFFEGDYATAEEEGTEFEPIDMDALTSEIQNVVAPAPEKEPKKKAKSVEPVAPVAPTAPVAKPTVTVTPAPPVVPPSTKPDELSFDDPTPPPAPQAPVAPIAEEDQAIIRLEYLLHQSKASGNNTLQHLMGIGKAVMEEFKMVKGDERHAALLEKAKQLATRFTS